MFTVPNENGVLILYMEMEELLSFPKDLIKQLESCATLNKSESGYLEYEVNNEEKIDEIREIINKRHKNKIRSESRESSLNILSNGVTEKEDIEKIYEAQNGLCYYSRAPLNNEYEIDHIIPVSAGGSSWPNNIALTTKSHNRNKKNLSKNKYLSILEKNLGKEWLFEQKKFIKKVDKIRRSIDKTRRSAIENQIEEIQSKLQEDFPRISVEYSLFMGSVVLVVDGHEVEFPAGFIRKKRKFNSYSHIKGIVHAIIGT